MALTAAICTQCGAQIQVDESKEAGICPCCETAFITEKVINKYITNNNFSGATINVQGGVDIENLYTLARRAVEANSTDDILKYYGQIRERNPNDWEAIFFYAWFENGENFDKYFKIVEDLIFKLENDKQIEAVTRILKFFKKINFTISLFGKTPFPFKNRDLYYNFVKRFFDEKQEDVLETAQYLVNYMYEDDPNPFYSTILSKGDKVYISFLQKYHKCMHLAPAPIETEEQCMNLICSIENKIEKLNNMIESEEDKKNNYLSYYKFLIERHPENLKPKNIEYIENRIKEFDSTYVVSNKIKKAAKKNYRKYKFEKSRVFLRKVSAILLVILSVIGSVMLFTTSHYFLGTMSSIFLLLLNKKDVDLSFDDDSGVIKVKLTISIILLCIFLFLGEEEFFWF